MSEVEHITENHVGAFLGLGCHGNERVWGEREFWMREFERKRLVCEEMRERQRVFVEGKRWKLES